MNTVSLIVLLCISCASSILAADTAQKPNIILIFTDDQGYQDLGCFGSNTIKTPHLDRMAAEGVRLTSFYAQPVCGVSRAALMTGSYPIRIAEPGNVKRLHTVPHPKEVTIAEVLKEAGYTAGIIGKWHLATTRKDLPTGVGPATMPNSQGFDYFYGTPKFNGFTVHVEDTDVRSPIFRNEEVVVETVKSWDNITADYTREAVEWIRTNAKKERPFFLYLAHNMPHIPLGASENFRGKSEGGFYGDTIEEIDWSCGEIFQTLKELGIDDNTLVIFTSDNGPWVETTRGMKPDGEAFIPRDHSGNANPYRGWKMSAWEGGSRVPFIARWPGRIPAGWESDEILTTMDLLPTFASIADAKLPDVELDGNNAIEFLTRETQSSPRDEYLYYSGCLLTGVRSDNWKLVLPREKSPSGLKWWGRMIEAVPQTMLFDLENDPGETTNVAAQNPKVVDQLMKRIERARTELGDIGQTGSGARLFDQGPRTLQSPVSRPPKNSASDETPAESPLLEDPAVGNNGNQTSRPDMETGIERLDATRTGRLDERSLLHSDRQPKEHYPQFTWDRIPLYMHVRKSKSYTDDEIAFLAKFPLITFEKANGHQDYGSVEAGTLKSAQAVKEINPNTTILYYRNVLVHYDGYDADKALGRIPEAMLHDQNGNTKLVRNRVRAYDLSGADLRSWWVDSCSSMTANSHIDGIFLDGNVKALEPRYLARQIGAAKKKQTIDGYHILMKQTREAIGPNKLMVANILRARFDKAGLEYLDYFDGSYLEGFFHNVGGVSYEEYVAKGIDAMQKAARQGKIIAFTTGFTSTGNPSGNRNALGIDEGHATVGSHAQAQAGLTYPLAIFLVCAERYSYFRIHEGYSANENDRWMRWFPEFDRPLGPPNGPAMKDGFRYTRTFRHATVRLDIQNRTASILWQESTIGNE